MPDFDVVVVGAGVAGLAALAALDQAGLRVLCIEARNRIGGRVFTIHDPLLPIPVELGAEFIHGRPPEIWQIARSAPLGIYDCQDASVDIEAGVVKSRSDSWEAAHHVMQDMRRAAAGGPDESFAAFLDRSEYPKRVKERSASFVEGFNAARKEVIGIASLAKDAQAADEIDGDRSFRFFAGYDALPKHIFRSIPNGLQKLRLNTVLSAVRWRSGEAALQTVSPLGGQPRTISARRLLLTVPLGVLQAAPGTPGAIEWDPVPHAILESASALAFGQVVRVVLRFREAFWENDAHFADAGFLLSDEQLFPTWWSPLAARAPVWTGWSAGPHADPLLGTPEAQVVERAVASLSRLLGTSASRVAAQLEHAYFHDWHADPFARGAYSYVPAGALSARERLALPVDDVLYFAGEATELRGHSATVHGALASGVRAAGQIIRAATR